MAHYCYIIEYARARGPLYSRTFATKRAVLRLAKFQARTGLVCRVLRARPSTLAADWTEVARFEGKL